jgi:hypothetical protein
MCVWPHPRNMKKKQVVVLLRESILGDAGYIHEVPEKQ